MKKLALLTMTAFFAALLIFSACKKENVKQGNKRIVGTWILETETSEYNSSSSSTDVYLPANDCFNDYAYSSTSTGSSTLTESSYSESWTNSSTSDGVTTTTSHDTTYTVTKTLEVTFFEDGTFEMYDYMSMPDENGNTEYEEMQMTGYWNWLDSYEEKVGINIVMTGGQYNKALPPMESMEMHLWIETLDKEVLHFTFDASSENSYSYNSYYTCYNAVTMVDDDITYTYSNDYNFVETGRMEFKKAEVER